MFFDSENRFVDVPLPKNWDPAVKYSPWIVWDHNVPQDILKTYTSDFLLRELVEIKPIPNPNSNDVNNTSTQKMSTSTRQQYGLFAKVNMPKGAFLGEYVGCVVHEDFLQKDRDYALYYCTNKYGNFYIDASSVGNETRFIRVVEEGYNLLFQHLNLDGKRRVWIELIKEIKSGEELTIAKWTCRFFGQEEGNILPREYQHIDQLVYDPRLSEEVVEHLQKINTLEDCNGQRGLFASRDLPSGIFIGEYCGAVVYHTNSEEQLNNHYLADYDNMYHNYVGHIRIDAQRVGNETRYINDYRGIQGFDRTPNARFNKVWLDRMRCLVEVIDFIPKDKEITVDYGEQYWSLRRHLLASSYQNLAPVKSQNNSTKIPSIQ